MEEEYTQNINPSTLAPRINKFNIRNTETTLKNQQASIQGLKTQIGQLAKLISEQTQGSLPSNTEFNPMEQLNPITAREKKGLIETEPESRKRIVVSKGKDEVDHSERKPISKEYKPCVPYPNETRKDHTDEQFVKFLKELLENKRKLDEASHETRSTSINEPCSSNNKRPIYEERRLQIEELDEWRTPVKEKPKAHEKSKRHHNEHRDETRQIKVGDKVLLDENDPRIATLEHITDRATPFTVMNIFPHSTVEVTHTVFGTFKVNNTRLRPYFDKIDSRGEEFQLLNPP
ncbi:hypothetical protein GOBAR_AA05477 [Gossypium barbadense]|uniref:Uncharacterized protein n=1 Tax=Gossypium barbadense TaxID=3634 RepID=A0A2P5YHS4_GOSBA|nr:hypothetical protein GOBAR_AA05477 [Gossypium barbadense]